jgi:hypothetical protein
MTSMFMRVNSKCAHQVRPPVGRMERCSTVGPSGDWQCDLQVTQSDGVRAASVAVREQPLVAAVRCLERRGELERVARNPLDYAV